MEAVSYKSFAMASKAFFGSEGKSLSAFQEELKALTPKDKQDIANGLAKQGITIDAMPATGSY